MGQAAWRPSFKAHPPQVNIHGCYQAPYPPGDPQLLHSHPANTTSPTPPNDDNDDNTPQRNITTEHIRIPIALPAGPRHRYCLFLLPKRPPTTSTPARPDVNIELFTFDSHSSTTLPYLHFSLCASAYGLYTQQPTPDLHSLPSWPLLIQGPLPSRSWSEFGHSQSERPRKCEHDRGRPAKAARPGHAATEANSTLRAGRHRVDDSTLFLGDGSLAGAPQPKLKSGGIRSVIKVVDEKCLYVHGTPAGNCELRLT